MNETETEKKLYTDGAIVNQFTGYDNMESNLVYALDKGYYYVAQLDAKWVEDTIQMKFGRAYSGITNKYTILIINSVGRPMLITNHDGKYWLTQRSEQWKQF